MSTNRQVHTAFRGLACPALLLSAALTCTAQTATGAGTASAPADAPAGAAAAPAPDPPDAGAPAAGAPAQNPPAAAPGPATQGPGQKTEQAGTEPAGTGFRVGDFTFKPGGRVKLDVIRDFDPIGNEDSFDTRTIPVDDSKGTNSNVIAKETRLSLDIRGPVEQRELRLYLETDFYGTSSALRLRHAYGTWGGLLAGQTWSTFVDEENLPSTIDFESPTAFALIRQAQVRWTQRLGGSVTWSVALEDNKSAIVVPSDRPGEAEYPSPDFVTRFRFRLPRAQVTTAAFVGAARFRPLDVDDPDTVTLWGTMVSAKASVLERDSVYGTVTYGYGIGRYRGGTTAIPDDNGELHAVGGTAFMGGYEHYWSERWSSNASYSIADTTDESFYTSGVNKQLVYGSVNLLYWFLRNRAWTGVEYLYGEREVFGPDSPTGSAHRVQYAVRFNLP